MTNGTIGDGEPRSPLQGVERGPPRRHTHIEDHGVTVQNYINEGEEPDSEAKQKAHDSIDDLERDVKKVR